MNASRKPPKCSARGCGKTALYFAPRQGLKKRIGWCSDACGAVTALDLKRRKDAEKAKQDRAEHRERKKAIETIGKVLKRVQRACNEFIKERDWHQPCISCGRPNDGQHKRDAGHYKAVGKGGGSPVRFHVDNIHMQCSIECNVHGGGGNHPGYRPNLVLRIGEERVRAVEILHAGSAKWVRADLEALCVRFHAEAGRLARVRELNGVAA